MKVQFQINAGTSNKRRWRLFQIWLCRPGVYLNPAFIRGPPYSIKYGTLRILHQLGWLHEKHFCPADFKVILY